MVRKINSRSSSCKVHIAYSHDRRTVSRVPGLFLEGHWFHAAGLCLTNLITSHRPSSLNLFLFTIYILGRDKYLVYSSIPLNLFTLQRFFSCCLQLLPSSPSRHHLGFSLYLVTSLSTGLVISQPSFYSIPRDIFLKANLIIWPHSLGSFRESQKLLK